MTVHSDWGDWVPTAVAEAEPDGLDIWYLGCNGFILKADDGTTVFIDPYLGTGDPPRTVRMIPVPFAPDDVQSADAILATHEHTDHTHGPSQAPILANTDATFFGPPSAIEGTTDWSEDYAVTAADFGEVTEGDSIEIGSLTIHVEAANDPDATHPVSYVIEHDAGTFFHGGDGRPFDGLESIGSRYDIDLAVVAFGSSGMILDKESREPTFTEWYGDENMTVKAAEQLQTDRLLPSHWDMWKGLTADPTGLHDHIRSFDYPQSLEIVEIGDRVEI